MWNKAKKVLADLGDRLASNFESVDCPNCGERINYGTYRYERYCPECGSEFDDSSEHEERLSDMARESGIQTDGRNTEDVAEEVAKRVASAIRDRPQQPPKEIYKEREVITREIVKIRCRHCGRLHEEKLDTCPHCGAPS